MKHSTTKRALAARSNKKPAARVAKAGALQQRQEQRKKTGQKRGPGKPFPKKNKWAFKPGESGNPNGRPKSITVADALRRALKEVDPRDRAGRTLAEIVADQLIHLATKGRGGNIKIRAIQEIVDRVEGKPRQSVEVHVPTSEVERYESMIAGYIESAKEQGIELSREQAINYLAEADNRILTVVAVASAYEQ
jgi:Family of unknown function (DUF5681)